jgi:hypothetical protein
LLILVQHDYADIIACDETPIWLDFVSDTTVNRTGAKEVSVITTGHEKTKLSVMLAAKSNGVKLKPHIVINRVRPIDGLKKLSHKIHVTYAKKSWFDDDVTEDFLINVVKRDFFKKKRLLVWDSFRCHISESTKKVLKQLNVDIAVIPRGTTKYIQPADVCWNKSFKCKMKEFYTDWLLNGEKCYTKGGNVKAVDFVTVCNWVISAWDSVTEANIVNSFATCGITNNIDGSEDGLISCFKKGNVCESGLELLKNATGSAASQEVEECESEFFQNVDECIDEFELLAVN